VVVVIRLEFPSGDLAVAGFVLALRPSEKTGVTAAEGRE
jgi:hypothetical protein